MEIYKAARNPTKSDVINDVRLFPTLYCRIADIASEKVEVIYSDVPLQKQMH